MEYAKFIEELRPLHAEALNLFDDPQTHNAPRFRKWRHSVTTLISAIEDRGYSIDCSISSRIFDIVSYGSVAQTERVAIYNQELQDTINELESIIGFFDKFGDPKAEAKKVQPPVLASGVEDNTVSTDAPRIGTLKERFESHPVVWGLALLAVGFVSGFGARGYFASEKATPQPAGALNCRVEGADRLAESHHARVGALQKQLLNLEASASDRTLISAYQDKYKEAADRVRQDIATENSAYLAATQQLAKTCQ